MARKLQGIVVSDKMTKTVVVAVSRKKQHPIYRKQYQATTRFKVHDAEGIAKVGDVVQIVETRPLSADKRWRLESKLDAGEAKS